MQSELIQKVIETTEGEIQTLLYPYYKGEEKRRLLEILEKKEEERTESENEELEDKKFLLSKITKRPEKLSEHHLNHDTYDTLEEVKET